MQNTLLMYNSSLPRLIRSSFTPSLLSNRFLNVFQVWSLGQPTPNFTLEGHEKGVNAVDYFVGGVSCLQHPAAAACPLRCSNMGYLHLCHQLTCRKCHSPASLITKQATGHS